MVIIWSRFSFANKNYVDNDTAVFNYIITIIKQITRFKIQHFNNITIYLI